MKRLFLVTLAALLAFPALSRAEGPDDKYIEIYGKMQEADQLAASGQSESARQRYNQVRTELLQLQTSYPNWNDKLIQYRLRSLDSKLGTLPKEAKPAPAPTTTPTTPAQPVPASPISPTPAVPQVQTPPPTTPFVQAPPPAANNDAEIRALQDQVRRLEAERAVLDAKLREALSAQPAAVDPRELSRAEERIRTLEKEKEILRVSVQKAEAKAALTDSAGAVEAKRDLAQANQKLAQQNDTITALRKEKEILETRVQEMVRADEESIKKLRSENEVLRLQLARKPASAEPVRVNNQGDDKELTSAKAALQSSRDTVTSLQVRLRALEDERDSLVKTRKDLESKLALTSPAPASNSSESAQVKRLQKERDDLQKKLNDTVRQLAENKSKTKQVRAQQPQDDMSALRARLEALEASKVPYTPEELALFKKPQEVPTVLPTPSQPQPSTEPSPGVGPLLAEAQRAFTARRFDEAEKKYLEALRIDDKNVATLQRLASAQLEQNRPQDADVTLKRALDQNPSEPRTLLLMGIAKFDQEKYDDALTHLSRSVQIDPQNPETQNYLGITLSQKGQRAAAETALRKAVQLDPGYKSAHYNLAVVYATQKPPFIELARWHYQKALAYGHPANSDLEKMIEGKQAAATSK